MDKLQHIEYLITGFYNTDDPLNDETQVLREIYKILLED